MSEIAVTKKLALSKSKRQILLGTVPYEKGFHFFTEHGKYTGITATSLVEFAEKLKTIPVQSVTFHFQRQDFQKWLKNLVGDEELAKRIDQIKEWPSFSSDEDLRKELFKVVQTRISQLTKTSSLK
ncbi:MAG: DUF5752 family protein [Candidatus Bathyarchaeota archaeon]|nr:DUF5752 family protein [Candidatus Bathyarchaeota archaeon]